MKHFKSLLTCIALAAMLGIFSTTASAQPKPYYGPLLYSMRRDTSVPPVYSGQPAQVTEGYLWLDDAMRLYPGYKIDSFLNTLTWGDTMKTLASVLYQAQDDNPLSLFMWSGGAMHPNPYKANPNHEQVVFEQRAMQYVGDTGRTGALVTADIIADVLVTDTFSITEPNSPANFSMVFVNATILDEIKGKMVPLCVGENMRAHRRSKGAVEQSEATVAWATYPIRADTGACLQFEYSPEWFRAANSDYGPPLKDSTGDWIKNGHEYIVFLNFSGVGADSVNEYFTVRPGMTDPYSGSNCGMYRVADGIVQDPNDDYGLGGSNLTVADWKARLRARIKSTFNS